MKHLLISLALLTTNAVFAADDISETDKEIIRMAMEHDAKPNRPRASESLQNRINSEMNGDQRGICLYEVRNPATRAKSGKSNTKVTAHECYGLARAYLNSNKSKYDKVFIKFGDSQQWTTLELKDVE